MANRFCSYILCLLIGLCAHEYGDHVMNKTNKKTRPKIFGEVFAVNRKLSYDLINVIVIPLAVFSQLYCI